MASLPRNFIQLRDLKILWTRPRRTSIQPEVKCSIRGTNEHNATQRRPEVATVKTRSLAASLNGELVFLLSVQKLLFVQDFRSISLQETHLSVFSVVFSKY